MGGNAFEDTEPLINEEYKVLVAEIIFKIKNVVIRIEPYISLPEK